MGTQTKELTQNQKAILNLQNLLARHKDQIALALPKHMTADRMLRVALTAATTNPELLKCDARSVASCIVQAAILGLEPNTPLGEAYLIPYKGICQLIPGWKGLLKLVRNTGELVMINAQVVRQNDTFEFEDGLDPTLRHKRAPGGPEQRGPVVSYWAGAILRSGGRQFVVLAREEAEAHGRRFSKTFGKGPWTTDFDAMALKTCIRKLCKYLPASVETQTACALDEQTEVGAPQQFSPEVPAELLPVLEPQQEETGE